MRFRRATRTTPRRTAPARGRSILVPARASPTGRRPARASTRSRSRRSAPCCLLSSDARMALGVPRRTPSPHGRPIGAARPQALPLRSRSSLQSARRPVATLASATDRDRLVPQQRRDRRSRRSLVQRRASCPGRRETSSSEIALARGSHVAGSRVTRVGRPARPAFRCPPSTSIVALVDERRTFVLIRRPASLGSSALAVSARHRRGEAAQSRSRRASRYVSSRTGVLAGARPRARQLAPGAGREAVDAQTRVDAPVQPADAVADRLAHPAHLAVAALVQDELEAGCAEAADAGRRRHAVLQLDTLGQRAQRLVVRLLPGLDLVDLLDAVARVGEPVRERAVVRQEQRTGRVDVEPADGHDARSVLDEIDDGGAPLRVAGGRDDARRLVQEHVRELLLCDRLPVDLDRVARPPRTCSAGRARR